MKLIIKYLAIVSAVLGLHGSLQAQTRQRVDFEKEEVPPFTVTPHTTFLTASCKVTTPVAFTISGVYVEPTGPTGVMSYAILKDENGAYLGSGPVNPSGWSFIPMKKTFPVGQQAKIHLYSMTADNLTAADKQTAGLRIRQFVYVGTKLDLAGAYPTGEGLVDASSHQYGRVLIENDDHFPAIKTVTVGRTKDVKKMGLRITCDYEGAVINLNSEVVATGAGKPNNILDLRLVDLNDRLITRGLVTGVDGKVGKAKFNRSVILQKGVNYVYIIYGLGGSYANGGTATFRFDTAMTKVKGLFTQQEITALSDLAPSAGIVTGPTVKGTLVPYLY